MSPLVEDAKRQIREASAGLAVATQALVDMVGGVPKVPTDSPPPTPGTLLEASRSLRETTARLHAAK